jgi:hypothetical protein
MRDVKRICKCRKPNVKNDKKSKLSKIEITKFQQLPRTHVDTKTLSSGFAEINNVTIIK